MNEYDRDSWDDDSYCEEKPAFDVYAMFPEAARRVRLLEEIKRFWPVIVERPVAKYSQPCNLGVSELGVKVSNPQAKNMLMKSKGTIARRIARRFGYEFGPDFVLTLTD